MRIVTVTAITPFDKKRSKVFFDEDFALVLYRGEIRRFQLKEGSVLSEEKYRELLTECLIKRAKARVLHLLKMTDKTEQELRRKLEESFYPQEAIDAAIEMAKGYRYVDDERYVGRYIRTYAGKKSIKQLRSELLHKGIDRGIIDAGFEENPVDEEEQARRILKKRGYRRDSADLAENRKTAAALARKGISYDVIHRVLAESTYEDGEWDTNA